MFDSVTGETSRFKIKHIEPVKNVKDTTNSGDNSQNDDNQTLFTATAQKVDKHKKRKNKRKMKRSLEYSSSDSGNSSAEEEPVEENNSIKSHRFQIIIKAESHKWELPGEMTDHVNHQFKYFIPEEDVEENLLVLRPVVDNAWSVQKLDNFVKSITGQSAQAVNQDATIEKFQTENFGCSRVPF